jgi:hypothetical protein
MAQCEEANHDGWKYGGQWEGKNLQHRVSMSGHVASSVAGSAGSEWQATTERIAILTGA